MTTRAQQTQPGRWVRFVFLAALVAVVTPLFATVTATAATGPGAGNRVGASVVVVEPLVGPPEHVRAGQRLGNDRRGVVTAVATGVAEKSEGTLSRLFGNRVRDERGSFGFPGGASRLTNAQAVDMAARVGYSQTNYIVRGQTVFTDGKTFIIQDTTSHSGGLSKMGKSVDALNSKGTRLGTYDYDLNYIGP